MYKASTTKWDNIFVQVSDGVKPSSTLACASHQLTTPFSPYLGREETCDLQAGTTMIELNVLNSDGSLLFYCFLLILVDSQIYFNMKNFIP